MTIWNLPQEYKVKKEITRTQWIYTKHLKNSTPIHVKKIILQQTLFLMMKF